MKADRLYAEFRTHGVAGPGDRLLLRAGDAVALVAEAADEGVPILGIDVQRAVAGDTPPSPQHLADFRARVAEGHGCWAEAEACIRAQDGAALLFAVMLGGDPLEAV
jgi:hypothetical protein